MHGCVWKSLRRPGIIHHVNDVTFGGGGGGGGAAIFSSAQSSSSQPVLSASQDSRRSRQLHSASVWTYFRLGPTPTTSTSCLPDIIHVMIDTSLPSLSVLFCIRVLKPKNEKWGRPLACEIHCRNTSGQGVSYSGEQLCTAVAPALK